MPASASDRQIDKFALRAGDVIITKDSETPSDIAISTMVPETLDGVICGYHLALLRPHQNRLDSEFLNILLGHPKIQYYFATRANGATRFGLPISSIKQAKLLIPPLDEQKEIASVFRSNEETQIQIKVDLSKLQTQKKALMQQLLTGKRRVKL